MILFIYSNNKSFHIFSFLSVSILLLIFYTSLLIPNSFWWETSFAGSISESFPTGDFAKDNNVTTFLSENESPISKEQKVGRNPTNIEINSETGKTYVSDFYLGLVYVLQGSKIVDTIAVNSSIEDIAINPITNRIYVGGEGQGIIL